MSSTERRDKKRFVWGIKSSAAERNGPILHRRHNPRLRLPFAALTRALSSYLPLVAKQPVASLLSPSVSSRLERERESNSSKWVGAYQRSSVLFAWPLIGSSLGVTLFIPLARARRVVGRMGIRTAVSSASSPHPFSTRVCSKSNKPHMTAGDSSAFMMTVLIKAYNERSSCVSVFTRGLSRSRDLRKQKGRVILR